jgi:hypothetical protein
MERQEAFDNNTRLKAKNEQLFNENKDLKNQIQSAELRAK